jgi:hypothetical protein
MFRRTISVLAVVAAAFGIVFAAAGPASAASNRMLTVWGQVHIEDYETFASNEHCYSSINTNRTANPSYPIEIEWVRTCGGEIRAELNMQVQVLPTNYLSVIGKVLFFEGTSTGTSDLDGQKNFTAYVPPGGSVPLNLFVWNTAEGEADDNVSYNLRLGNVSP